MATKMATNLFECLTFWRMPSAIAQESYSHFLTCAKSANPLIEYSLPLYKILSIVKKNNFIIHPYIHLRTTATCFNNQGLNAGCGPKGCLEAHIIQNCHFANTSTLCRFIQLACCIRSEILASPWPLLSCNTNYHTN